MARDESASEGGAGTVSTPAIGPGDSPALVWQRFWLGLGVLTAAFSPWLIAWAGFALSDELASYVLLIPVVSFGLLRKARGTMPAPSGTALGPGLIALAAAGLCVALAVFSRGATEATRHDYLAPAILGYVACLVSWGFLTLGSAAVRHHAFALGFLAFAAPLPSWAVNGLEIFFQHTSAEVAAWMMQLAGIPTLRSGLVFQLPGITIQVAQECSGIRSSLVLFIVSLYGGHLILRRPSRRWLLALFVIPLGIVRNGFRILTIAALCTYVSPNMIDSPIHHRGGPIFFGLSLVPLFLVLLWLRRSEQGAGGGGQETGSRGEG